MQNPVQRMEMELRQQTLLGILASDPRFNLSKAAKAIGVKPRTISDWRRADKEFDRQLTELMQDLSTEAVDELEDTCHDVAKKGDVQALKFMLTAHKPDRYRPESKQLTNNGTVINIGQLTVCPREGAELESPAKLIESPRPEE